MSDIATDPPQPLLTPGATCWRLEPAGRAALLVDAAAYFAAAKAALLRARRSVLLLAWDFDPQVRLTPDDPNAAQPDAIGDLLVQLTAQRPELSVRVLRWDMPLPLVLQHPIAAMMGQTRSTGPRLQYRLDDRHPSGACHHQKVLVIDDAVAFCGGMDFAADRWDTTAHRDDEPRRRTPDGTAFGPRHDVMMMVDGAAAAALGDLARERWLRATGETLPPPGAPDGDPWPARVEPDLRDVRVGIARTAPGGPRHAAARENEALHLAAIAGARHLICLENQYFCSDQIADALVRRLREPHGPEIVLLLGAQSQNWFDRATMDTARVAVMARLRAADRHGRLRLWAPLTAGGGAIQVHSKVSVIDDRLLRVGSANLNNRSLGFDTECDIAIEAPGPAVQRLFDRLCAEHLGVPPETLRAAIDATGSVIAAAERLHRRQGRRLHRIGLPLSAPLWMALGRWHPFDPLGRGDDGRPWRR